MKELSKKRLQRLARKEADKQLREIYKRYTDTQRYGVQTYIVLDEPLRRGFQRNLVLKPSVIRRSDFEVLETLVPLINIRYTSNNRSFKSYDSKTGKMTREFVHSPKGMDQKEYDKLDERQKSYFTSVARVNKWSGVWFYSYYFNHEHLLVSKMSKWFVFRVPILDPDNQSNADQLNNDMYGRKQLMAKVDRMFSNGWGYDYDICPYLLIKRIALQEMKAELELDRYDDEDSENYYESVEQHNSNDE